MEEKTLDCKAIVMDYLLHYCYRDSAKAFLKETNHLKSCSKVSDSDKAFENEPYRQVDPSSKQWSSLEARRDIYTSIKQGDIQKAFTLIEQHFPSLMESYNTLNRKEINSTTALPSHHFTLYNLRCQQFIEALRTSGPIEAIQFAQFYLRPCHKLYPDLTNSVTALIAYEDLENEWTKDLLSQQRREDIADQVNEMILEYHQVSRKSALEKLWRQKTIVQVELDDQIRKEMLQTSKQVDHLEKVTM